ncbi:hypothetical protein O9993_00770 [Vibrio lentus]|nr:hypothetical protein [Vibrio lentus]
MNGAWSVEGVDLTSFADGSITIEADTIDIAGNPASAVKNSGPLLLIRTAALLILVTLDGFYILRFRSGQLTTMQG